MWASNPCETETPDEPTAPACPRRGPGSLGRGVDGLPRREAPTLRLHADRAGLQPDALPAVREARLDPRPGHVARRAELGARDRSLGPGAIVDNGRGADRLP